MLVFVRSCSSINNKIISCKKLFHHSQLEALKKKKSGVVGTVGPVSPLIKTALAPGAVHFASVDRPGHGTSHVLQNGRLFTFMHYLRWLEYESIISDYAMGLQYNSLHVSLPSKPLLQYLRQLMWMQNAFSAMPSVLWHCWLGGRKGIRPVKTWVVGCWRSYLSGSRCRLAYGPADATATHCLLLQ